MILANQLAQSAKILNRLNLFFFLFFLTSTLPKFSLLLASYFENPARCDLHKNKLKGVATCIYECILRNLKGSLSDPLRFMIVAVFEISTADCKQTPDVSTCDSNTVPGVLEEAPGFIRLRMEGF